MIGASALLIVVLVVVVIQYYRRYQQSQQKGGKQRDSYSLSFDSADEEVELLLRERSFMQAISTGSNTDSDLRYLAQ